MNYEEMIEHEKKKAIKRKKEKLLEEISKTLKEIEEYKKVAPFKRLERYEFNGKHIRATVRR